jgi:ribosomal-protein-alanine N-acetyltransferase
MADAPQRLDLPADATLETPRLILRRVERHDLPALLAVNGDPAVTRYLPYETWRDGTDAEAWFERVKARREAGAADEFALVHRGLGHAIGSCLLFHPDAPSARAELGYVLARSHWGAGYMREALRAFVDFAFGPGGLRRLEAQVDPRNGASARLLERLGFAREGLLRQRWAMKGEFTDSIVYGLLRSDRAHP